MSYYAGSDGRSAPPNNGQEARGGAFGGASRGGSFGGGGYRDDRSSYQEQSRGGAMDNNRRSGGEVPHGQEKYRAPQRGEQYGERGAQYGEGSRGGGNNAYHDHRDGNRPSHQQQNDARGGANLRDQERSPYDDRNHRNDYAQQNQDNYGRNVHHGQNMGNRDNRGGQERYSVPHQDDRSHYANNGGNDHNRGNNQGFRNDSYADRGNSRFNGQQNEPHDRANNRPFGERVSDENSAYGSTAPSHNRQPRESYYTNRDDNRSGFQRDDGGFNKNHGHTDNRHGGGFSADQGFSRDQGFGRDQGGGRGYGGDRGFNRGDQGFNRGDQGFNRGDQGFNRGDQGFNRGDQGFNRGDQGFNRGDQGLNRGDQGFGGNRKFDNDGGFGSRGGDRSERPVHPSKEMAPRDWVPEDVNVDDLIEATADRADDLHIDQDQSVEVRNSDITTRLTSWENSGLHESIIKNLKRLKFSSVRPIQGAVIPQIMAGYDVVGQAETGGGKTAAFGLPIIHAILNTDKDERRLAHDNTTPFALILAPTRELARQIFDALRTFATGTDLKIRVTYGEMPRRMSANEIQNGTDILVGTCGRVMDFIEKGEFLCDRMKFLVLDEADHLLRDAKDPVQHLGKILMDPGFMRTADFRQTILTSATFNAQVESIAKGMMKPLPGEQDLVRIVLAKGRLNPRCQLVFYETNGTMGKQQKLRELIGERDANGEVPKTLVFVERKAQCDHIALKIGGGASGEFKAQTLHGDRGQDVRDKLILEFRQSKLKVLVATDVCSRGIDIKDLDRVINFDVPNGMGESAIDTFIHRVGRCGRLKTGHAITLIDPTSDNDKKLSVKLVELLKAEDRECPPFLETLARENAHLRDSEPRGRGGNRGFNGRNDGGGFGGRNGGGGFGGGNGGGGFGGGNGGGAFGGGNGGGAFGGGNGGGAFGGGNGGGAFGGGTVTPIGFAAANAPSNDETGATPASGFQPKLPTGFSAPVAGGFGLAAKIKSEEKEKDAAAASSETANEEKIENSTITGPTPPTDDVAATEDIEDDW